MEKQSAAQLKKRLQDSPESTPGAPKASEKSVDLFSKLLGLRQPPMDDHAETPESATADPKPPEESLPEDLVKLVMKRHGFTREEAEQAIRDTGVY